MSTSTQIIKNVFSNWAYFFLQIVTSFFLMPFLVHSMGDTIYGIWTLILSTAGYMGLVNFEIRSAVIKYISEFRAKKEQEKINEIASTSFYSYTILGVIILFITLITANYFDKVFKIDTIYAGEAKIAFIFIGLSLAVNLPFAVFGGLIWGYQKYDFNSAVEIGMLIGRTALIIFFIKTGYGLIALSLITIIINIIGQIARVFYAYKLNPELKISFKLFKKETWKLISNYSLFAFLITIAAQLIYNTDNIVIGYFMGASAITHFAIGGRMVAYSGQGISVISSVLMPAFSDYESRQETDKLKQLFILGSKYTLIMTLPILLIFVFMGKTLIVLWMGKKYLSSVTILILLLLPHAFTASEYITNSILFGIGKLKLYSYLLLGEALANFVLSIILVKKYGLIGVALGTTIPLFISKGFILPVYVCHILKQPVSSFIKESFLRPVIINLPFGFLIFLLSKFIIPINSMVFLAEILISLFLYIILVYKFSLTGYEKSVYNEKFRNIKDRIKT